VEVTRRWQGKAKQRYQAEHVIIATGSVPIDIDAAPLDGERIVNSTAPWSSPRFPSGWASSAPG
jgi:dihydrolipoamide dehydrogenase